LTQDEREKTRVLEIGEEIRVCEIEKKIKIDSYLSLR